MVSQADDKVRLSGTESVKIDIVQNAIDLGHALTFPEVRVAIMSAMETVNPAVPSTIEAAALCKMAERGQITGGILDGPLALDNAINEEAAAIKHIVRFTLSGDAIPGADSFSLAALSFDTLVVGTSPLTFSQVILADAFGGNLAAASVGSGSVSVNIVVSEPMTLLLLGAGIAGAMLMMGTRTVFGKLS